MPLYKFKSNDIIYNRIKAHPKVDFKIYGSKIYYKNADQYVVNNDNPSGHINLHEINVNRGGTNLVYPFLPKGSDLSSFKTVSNTSFYNSSFGDEIDGSYPLTASVSRESHTTGSSRSRIDALRNVLNFYKPMSEHYGYDTNYGNKSHQPLNLISIPSIFYGNSIKKGTTSLKFYVTGTLIGELRDENNNGELIQVGPTGSVESGSVAGVVLYNEGFIILTGSWDLSSGAHTINYNNDGSPVASSWLQYAVGANDDIPEETTVAGTNARASASYDLTFEGVNYVPTVTMFAHAPKGMLNNSGNPTFIESGSYPTTTSSLTSYLENSQVPIKNIVSSSYDDHKAEFHRETYISKIGIYDEDKNLIAITKLATPIKKTDKREYTFKMKLDF